MNWNPVSKPPILDQIHKKQGFIDILLFCKVTHEGATFEDMFLGSYYEVNTYYESGNRFEKISHGYFYKITVPYLHKNAKFDSQYKVEITHWQHLPDKPKR